MQISSTKNFAFDKFIYIYILTPVVQDRVFKVVMESVALVLIINLMNFNA